jgi:hypothetical protein
MIELAKIPFPEVKRLAESARAIVILPIGVVEEHGAHLPLGLDSFAAEVYAASAAPHLKEAGYEVVVAPTINYGVARAAIDFPGTLSLEPETLRSMVVEIGRSLARHGLNRLVILNGHRDLHHMSFGRGEGDSRRGKVGASSVRRIRQRSANDRGLLPRGRQTVLPKSKTGPRRPRR